MSIVCNKLDKKYNLNSDIIELNNDEILMSMIISANLNFEMESIKDIHINNKTNLNDFHIEYTKRIFRTKISDYIVNRDMRKVILRKQYDDVKRKNDFILMPNKKIKHQ